MTRRSQNLLMANFKKFFICNIKELANLNGYKFLETATLNVVKQVVCAKPAKITTQMQFLVIAVVVSITTSVKDHIKMETVQTKPLPLKTQPVILVWY